MSTYRSLDSDPKEQFIYHNAGADGRGGSSYIDTVICRDRDANVNWADAADSTLEERVYYCHNWRGDVSVLIEDDADMVEWVKYSSYGVPFGLPKGVWVQQSAEPEVVCHRLESAASGLSLNQMRIRDCTLTEGFVPLCRGLVLRPGLRPKPTEMEKARSNARPFKAVDFGVVTGT